MLKSVARALLAVILLAAVGWYGWQLGPWADGAPGERALADFAAIERASTPNQFLVAPPGTTPKAAPDAESPVFPVPAERLRDAMLALAGEAPRTALLERSPDGMRMLLVQRSAVLRFPDYIDVAILPAGDGGSTVAIYSRSRFGYSDMGVNRRRVEAWLAELRRRVGA
ncbi:DUF1499 domain-containing protein [Skermanella mucosa]|uniref:DUF1499 domain-containing protein n=1 Tax=Skermanella mucosa TaxID=1789672 RepID=UPI00192C153D|nr:DUF1499 domain-containing protein [Skermanella mucosa]UEM18752.1 DUF1499 domain-containing protein [Skermanella mucosa]